MNKILKPLKNNRMCKSKRLVKFFLLLYNNYYEYFTWKLKIHYPLNTFVDTNFYINMYITFINKKKIYINK